MGSGIFRGRAVPASALALLPLGGLVTWWAFDDGGYDPVDWEPGTVLALVLAALVLVTPGLRTARRPTRAALVALAALAAYTAWSYASIAWAGSPGTALEGAHRCLLLLAVVAVCVLAAPPPAVLRGAAVAVALVFGLAAVWTAVRVLRADVATGLFLDGRLTAPMGYVNASAAFLTTGALLGLLLAARRDTPAPVRPLLVGFAVVEVGLAAMTSSRGWLFTLPLVVVAALALTGGRLRATAALGLAGVAVLPVLDRLLEPTRVGGGKNPREGGPLALAAAQDVLGALLVLGGAAALVTVLLVVVDRRVDVPASWSRAADRAAPAMAALVVVAGLAAVAVAVADPGGRLDRAWEDFKANDLSEQSGGDRLSSTGSSRYDFWRVGVALAERRPLAGLGQDNFAQAYLARRGVDNEEPRWVHSLPLRAVVHTGLVGAALLLAALAALVAAGIRRREPPDDRGLAGVALVPLVVWTLHGSVDWLWEFPLLSIVALGLAAAAGSTARGAVPADGAPPRVPRAVRRAGTAAAVALAAIGAVAVLVDYVAQRDVRAASRGWPGDPAGAFERLDQARGLTPSARPALVEGIIAQRVGDPGRARAAFAEAAEREPADWFARFQLALLREAGGDRAGARRLLAEAARRNPKEPVIKAARAALDRGRTFTVRDAERLLAQRAQQRFGAER